MTRVLYISILFIVSALLAGCADKLDLSEFPITSNGGTPVVSDTSYVQQSPTWNNYNAPEDVFIGKEPLVYIADTKNNRIVQLDLSGAEVGSVSLGNPVAISQNNNYDLLVIGDSVSTLGDTLNAVYRYKLVAAGGIITSAQRISMITSDYATPVSSRKRKFTGISVFSDNSYLVTRVGPENLSFLDPDNAILKIKGINSITSVTVLQGFQATGSGVFSIDKTSSITVIPGSSTDFVITRNSPDFGFKVSWFEFDDINGSYNPKFLPESNADITKIQLGTPEDLAIDDSKNLYVVDSQKDSLYKFNSNGKLMAGSFGGPGLNANQLNSPKGTAFFNKVLYIADAQTGRIIRYKLSTDLN